METFACGEHPPGFVIELVDVFLRQKHSGCLVAGDSHEPNGNRSHVHLDLASFADGVVPLRHFRFVAVAKLRELAREIQAHLFVGIFVDAFLHEQPRQSQRSFQVGHFRRSVDAVGFQRCQMFEDIDERWIARILDRLRVTAVPVPHALRVAERTQYVLQILCVVMWKEKLDHVQRLVAFNPSCKRRSDHPTHELRDGRSVHDRRKLIITSARGQSQPVVNAVLKRTTFTSGASWIREASIRRMMQPPY